MKLYFDDVPVDLTINQFPTGEVNVKLPDTFGWYPGRMTIKADWVEYGNNIIPVMGQILDAITHHDKFHSTLEKILVLPYLPYSRQDRVCNKGESAALEVFTKMINSFNFDKVITWDNHSDVGTALINNCVNIEQWDLLKSTNIPLKLSDPAVFLVSPDQGATKKVKKIADEIGFLSVVRCDKVRNTANGNILNAEVFDKEIVKNAKELIVVDDICDGGATFLILGKKLKEINPDVVLSLYITHGFFTKGLDKLNGMYDHIYTTYSVCRLPSSDKLTIIKG